MNLHRDDSGFTMIEILVAVGLLTFLTAATLRFADFVRHDIAQQESIATRNTEQGMFVSLLGQNAYVGALAEYEENKALRQCLDADGALCQIKKDYPLINYDFAHGEVMTNTDTENSNVVANDFSFQVHCPLNQPECDQADYLSVRIRSSIKTAQGLQYSMDKVVVVQPKRSNVITMVPNTKLEKGSPVNIIIFVDGSNSMSGIQASFKATLEKLIDQMKDLDASIYLLPLAYHTWSNFLGSYKLDSSGNKVSFSWADQNIAPGGTVRYDDQMFKLNSSKYDANYPNTYSDIYTFNPTMSDAARLSTVNALKARVDSMFTGSMATSTTMKDAALCGFMRFLSDASQGLAPLTFNSTTPTVLMILTNEDDESVLVNSTSTANFEVDNSFVCATGVSQKWQKDAPGVMFYGEKVTYSISGTATTDVDGAPLVKTFTDQKLDGFIKYRSTNVPGADCLADALTTDKTDVDYGVYYWQRTSNYTLTSCKIVDIKESYLGLAAGGTHPCDAINLDSSKYPTMKPGTCVEKTQDVTQMGWAGRGTTYLGVYVPEDLASHTSGKITDAIYNLLKSKFNLNNFLFSAVINPTSGVCALTPGAHYGTRYEELAGMPGINSQIIPICSSDYGSQLLNISTKLSTLGISDFTLPTGTGPRISGIDILRGSTVVAATSGADYTINGDLVNFSVGFIQPDDIVRIYLK